VNKLRERVLCDQLDGALARAAAAQEGHLDADTRTTCTAILRGAAVAAAVAVTNIKALEKLWGFRGSPEKATTLLETFSFALLSTWLGWMDVDRPEEEKRRARESWGEVVLTLFDDVSEDNLNKFIGRDLQRGYDGRLREERRETGEGGGSLVGWMLLLSDAIVAVGGRPLIEPTPLTGYPYDGMEDMVERGGVKQTAPFATIVDVMAILDAVASGAKICAEYYRERTEPPDEVVGAALAQVRQLLSQGHTLEELERDARWCTWIEFLKGRGLLEPEG
jgi:hypothetical protein